MAQIIIPFTGGSSGNKSESHQQTGASGSVLWDAIYNGAGDGSDLEIKAGWLEGENWDVELWRSYLTFDTSVLNGATINSAVIRLAGTQSWRNISESSQVGSFPSTDYADLKTTTDYVELPIQGTGTGVGSQIFSNVDLTLTGAGLSNIDSSGTTQYSFRGTGDTTDRGTTITDRYTYVVLTGASLVIQYNPIIVFEESISVGASLETDQQKIFSESIAISPDLRVDGLLPGKTFFESISIGESFGQTFTKTFLESIMIGETLKKFVNGVLVGKWSKVSKIVTGWTEQTKITSNWRKTPKK